MSTTTDPIRPDGAGTVTGPTRRGRAVAATCLAGAALAVAAPVVTGSLPDGAGGTVTAALADATARFQGGAILATLGAAALLVAAARLSRSLPGLAGSVAGTAGAAVAVLFAAMYAAFGSGALVAGLMLDNPSGAVGEGTLLLVNLVEVTRYGPGLALVAAALAARARLPRPVVLSAGGCALLTVVPFTSWIAALLVPVWLGVAGAVADRRAG